MKLVFLGTSAGKPTLERNVTSLVLNLMDERKSLWLFDCGESTQLQMMKAHISIAKLEMIFMTHLHGDHLFGLPGILTTRSLQQNMSPLTLIGPKGIKEFVTTVLKISHSELSYTLNVIELEQQRVVFEDNLFRVETDLLEHRVPSFGYRIIEKDRLGPLNKNKLQQDNISIGYHYNQLKNGDVVTLEDGRIINGKDYLGVVKKGKTLAILGDTKPCKASVRLAQNVDLLVHEGTQGHALVEKAASRGHSTTVQAAEIAKQSGAKRLIVTHISPRYSLNDQHWLLQECQSVFPNSEMATDFATFII